MTQMALPGSFAIGHLRDNTDKAEVARHRSPGHMSSRHWSAFLDHRTNAFLQGYESFLGRDGGYKLVVVPRIFRVRRLFHLEQISRMNLAAVRTNRTLAKQ